MITAERLRELLHYDPATGVFTRLSDVKGGATLGYTIAKAGDVAGGVNNLGYVRISVDGKRYFAHRLAFLYMTGNWPADEIDHVDLNRSNNVWKNLRPATHAQNLSNTAARSHNKGGIKGVRKTANGTYAARITLRGETYHLGNFSTPQAAHSVYMAAARGFHGEFARAS